MTAIHRRTFLRGLGGAAVAAPFLGSVWERAVRGQAAVAPPRPLILMFTHYGCVTTKWFPQKSHGALVAGDIANSIAPLAPYVAKLLIPRGIRAMNEWTQDNTGAGHGRGQGNDTHINACGSYFTCQPVTPNTDNPFDFSQATKFNAVPLGTSLDHVIAQQLGTSGTPLFMRVGNTGGTQGESPQSNISYIKASTDPATAGAMRYPGLGMPKDAFTLMTGLFGQGSPSPDTYAAARGKRVSDLVKADLDSFKRLNMSKADRSKVDAWEALLNATGTTMAPAPAQCTADVAARLGATPGSVASAGMSDGTTDVLTAPVTSSLDGADMYSVMAVLSAVCNYSPVSVLKYPPNYYFKGLGIPIESASLSHRLNNANLSGTCLADALMYLQTIDRYYATKFANLIGMLDSLSGSTGSLLDDSAVVWFQELSDGLAQNLNNLPIMQAGGCGGYFKTGWTINVEDGSATLTQGHSDAQCADGTATGMVNGLDGTTGTPANVANAPINKYFCNLMNAVGLKGDASSGFPQKGGTAPVTKFGYSDLTTDFCGGAGAVAGATIHSPGEYTSLKANP